MNHKPLIISGSSDFKKSVIQSAIFANLSISFADKLMQNEFIHQKEIIENDRKKFIADGGIIVTKRPNPKSVVKSTLSQTVESVAKNELRLPTLSQLSLVHSESEGTDLLLQTDESCQLEQLAKTAITMCDGTFLTNEKNFGTH